jgi:carboxypeptidase Q
MPAWSHPLLTSLVLVLFLRPAHAQTFATSEPVLEAIWEEGMERSQVYPLAQVLLDSIGPRLTGTPQQHAAHDWAVSTFESWGVPARNEQYGTWTGWNRGATHADLIAPRVRSLDATLLAWSPGTHGPVEGRVLTLPATYDPAAIESWWTRVPGSFVAATFPQPTCRPDGNWEEHARPETVARLQAERQAAEADWSARIRAVAGSPQDLARRLEAAGAAGVLTSLWARGWGVERIFGAQTETIPTLGVSCEDYGLLARLAAHEQEPEIRVDARSEFLGDMPTFNTIAEIRGAELPDEYVILSAHFDSWDGASGATDNGTGSVMMMEAMRILSKVYPNPRRTILVGLWGGEEQGLNGSRAFTEDHPDIVENLHALFNQDNGTGRVRNISMSGFTGAGEYFARWFARIPPEIVSEIEISNPGFPAAGGTDHASFVCHGAPGFMLSATSWDYFTYTWHTNRDTLDKIVFDDLRQNAVLAAMLAYLAAEDAEHMPRDRRTIFPEPRQPRQPAAWPDCAPARRAAP